MPRSRRWTLMLVPEGCDEPRTWSLSERLVKRMLITGAVLTSALLLFTGAALGRVVQHQASGIIGSAFSGRDAVQLEARLRTLDDTIAALERRDDQIRLLAGLPSEQTPFADSLDSARAAQGTPQNGTAMAGLTHVDGLIARANVLAASFERVSDTLAQNVEKYASIPSIMPTAGWLSSAFSRSRFHPILHIARPHEGIDVSAPMGAPIVAPAAGTVTLVTQQRGSGNVLEIDHGNGIVTKYAHCSRIDVRVGQHVKRGQIIANVGSTGLSTGPHLHYEIHVHGKVVDPLTYVMPSDAIPD